MKKKWIYFGVILMSMMVFSCQEDTIIPDEFGSLFGEVLLESDNTPLENVKITTNPPTNSIFTDNAGRFALENISTNAYTVRAEIAGYVTAIESVTVYANQTANVIIKLTPDTISNEQPGPPFLPVPADGSVDQSVDITLSWSSFDSDDDDLTYDVNLFNSDQTQSMILATGTPDTLLEVSLDYNETYFWQVVVHDDKSDPVFGEVWSFTTEPFPDHRFLFSRQMNGKYEIFSADMDGNMIQLTDNGSNNWRPVMNHQRTKIAFISDAGIEPQLYIMDRDGSNVQQVTSIPIASNNNLELDFCWSPDDTKLLYMNNVNLYQVNTDGSGLNLFATAPAGYSFIECDWTNQGNLIIARTTGANPYASFIFTFDENGNYLAQVTSDLPGGEGGPDLSINGLSMLYTYDLSGYENVDGRQLDTHIFVKDINGVSTIDLSVDKPDGTNDYDPRYSPDGSKIIFVNTNNDGISPKNIWIMDAVDGDNRTLLFENAETPDWR